MAHVRTQHPNAVLTPQGRRRMVACVLDDGWTIEAAATLHKGPSFKSYFELRDIIASRSDAFARGFSEALIEYALGRPVGFRDEPLINGMLNQSGKNNLAIREFIHALINSREFHTK